jgi:uncharacterized protein YutE (UPF0331/DUF86 family)
MKRLEQYHRKIDFIIEKINTLPQNIAADIFYMDALFYRLQVAIDATMDIIAMLCKDFGINVHDDYMNISELEKIKIFPPSEFTQLRKLNGLRNVLVHKYNKIEEDLILQEKDQLVEKLNQFVDLVKGIIDERLQID